MKVNLELELEDGWGEDLDLGELVSDAAVKAVRDYTRTITIEHMKNHKSYRAAIERMLDSKYPPD
tara:strand:+ start:19861 stop:20055 length:195 start_codon:yes stop_codon:yes gene_type:complete